MATILLQTLFLSSGGSALLPAPIHPLTLEEKLGVIKLLVNKGATIQELNTVRKNLSAVKGGRLAEIAKPAKVWLFIIILNFFKIMNLLYSHYAVQTSMHCSRLIVKPIFRTLTVGFLGSKLHSNGVAKYTLSNLASLDVQFIFYLFM